MLRRRSLLVGATLLPIGAAGCRADTDSETQSIPGEPTDLGRPLVTFASTPDLFNADIGDLSGLERWDGGPNSINDSWRRAIAGCLGELATHRPDAVFVAGDLVEGRWNLDTEGRELFGRVSSGTDPRSLAMCRRAITTAGDVYWGQYVSTFRDLGLRLLPALGDHDIMDDRSAPDLNNRWSPGGVVIAGQHEGERDNRYYLVPHTKREWGRHFTHTASGHARFANRPVGTAAEHTAYAVDLGPALRLITVDVFTVTPEGVRLGVFGPQLEWLRRTIRMAKRQGRVVIVQGHIPVMKPYRAFATGDLHVPEGRASDFYRVMESEGVDFYFCGEVHDTTVQQKQGGPVQVSHGSIIRAAFNFLVGRVYADRTVVLDYHEMDLTRRSRESHLWCSDSERQMPEVVEYGRKPVSRGRLVVRDRRIIERTHKLGEYDRFDDTFAYNGNLSPELV